MPKRVNFRLEHSSLQIFTQYSKGKNCFNSIFTAYFQISPKIISFLCIKSILYFYRIVIISFARGVIISYSYSKNKILLKGCESCFFSAQNFTKKLEMRQQMTADNKDAQSYVLHSPLLKIVQPLSSKF